MTFRNTTRSWGTLSKALHWLIVLLIINQWFIARARGRAAERARETRRRSRWHKSFGMTILDARDHPVSVALDESRSRSARGNETLGAGARQISHVLLYALIFAMPLTGWMMSSAKNYPGELVQAVPVSRSRRAGRENCSGSCTTCTTCCSRRSLVVALLHVAGALKHHFIDKNDVLKRMLPFGGVK